MFFALETVESGRKESVFLPLYMAGCLQKAKLPA
jgi:hypothetical protein